MNLQKIEEPKGIYSIILQLAFDMAMAWVRAYISKGDKSSARRPALFLIAHSELHDRTELLSLGLHKFLWVNLILQKHLSLAKGNLG